MCVFDGQPPATKPILPCFHHFRSHLVPGLPFPQEPVVVDSNVLVATRQSKPISHRQGSWLTELMGTRFPLSFKNLTANLDSLVLTS